MDKHEALQELNELFEAGEIDADELEMGRQSIEYAWGEMQSGMDGRMEA